MSWVVIDGIIASASGHGPGCAATVDRGGPVNEALPPPQPVHEPCAPRGAQHMIAESENDARLPRAPTALPLTPAHTWTPRKTSANVPPRDAVTRRTMPAAPVGVTVTRTRSPARKRDPTTRNGVTLRAIRTARRVVAARGARAAAGGAAGAARGGGPRRGRAERARAGGEEDDDGDGAGEPHGIADRRTVGAPAPPGVDEAVPAIEDPAQVVARCAVLPRGAQRGPGISACSAQFTTLTMTAASSPAPNEWISNGPTIQSVT